MQQLRVRKSKRTGGINVEALNNLNRVWEHFILEFQVGTILVSSRSSTVTLSRIRRIPKQYSTCICREL